MQEELSSERADFREGERLDFYGQLLAEITLERRKRREFNWSGEILLFLKEYSIGATKSGIENLEVREKFRPRETKLR